MKEWNMKYLSIGQAFSERHENAADAIGLCGSTALADDDEPFDLGFGNSVFSPGQSFDVDSVAFKGANAISSKVSFDTCDRIYF